MGVSILVYKTEVNVVIIMMEMVVNFRSHSLMWPLFIYWTGLPKRSAIECFQSHDKQSYMAKDNVCIKIEFRTNSYDV